MHELSLAIEIGRLAAERLGDEVAMCRLVGVDVGDDSGVEPAALEFCLQAVLGEPPWQRARPVVHRRPGDIFQVSYFEVDDGCPDD